MTEGIKDCLDSCAKGLFYLNRPLGLLVKHCVPKIKTKVILFGDCGGGGVKLTTLFVHDLLIKKMNMFCFFAFMFRFPASFFC